MAYLTKTWEDNLKGLFKDDENETTVVTGRQEIHLRKTDIVSMVAGVYEIYNSYQSRSDAEKIVGQLWKLLKTKEGRSTYTEYVLEQNIRFT